MGGEVMIQRGPLAAKSKQQGRCKEFFRLMERKAVRVHCMFDLCVYAYLSPLLDFNTSESYQHLISCFTHPYIILNKEASKGVKVFEPVPVIVFLLSQNVPEATVFHSICLLTHFFFFFP